MVNRFQVQQKLLIPYLGSILLLFLLSFIVTLLTLRGLVRESVRTEARELLEYNTAEIRSFFAERGRIPLTLFQDQFVLDWFLDYDRFRKPVGHDRDYHRIIAMFNALLDSDSTLNSVYFATDNTQEYFDEDGRFEEDGYLVKERSWWHKAVRTGRLYCELGGYDYEDSTMAASLQMPVYIKSGRLLGVGGVDIEIRTISEMVSRIKYKGQGQAFLIDESGSVFVFPGPRPDLWYMRPLRELDESFHADGFEQLAASMQRYSNGIYNNLIWEGNSQYVFFRSVQSDKPYLRWQLALMIPSNLVNDPVRQKTWATMRWIFIAGILIILTGTWRIRNVLRPLDALAARLHTIANEKSDLTQELPVLTRDAIGQTANNFNIFQKQIRNLVSSLAAHTRDVADRINHLHQSHQTIASSGREVSGRIDQVADTSRQMVQHVDEMMHGVKEVTRLSKQFLEIVDKGKSIVQLRMNRMGVMTHDTINLYEEMKILHVESDNLVGMVRVIEDINNRISMLSINASIEAVKAGERGRGFAVVAKEIENLSQMTTDTNQQTLEVVRSFSDSMEKFENDLQTMKDTIVEEKRSFTAISEMFLFLADQAQYTDKAAIHMQVENQQQFESLQMINDMIQHISGAAQQVAESISNANEQIRNVHEHMQALQESANTFKVS